MGPVARGASGGPVRDAASFLRRHGGADADPQAFADAWRARYEPGMGEVRSGRRPSVRLDVLHRENLVAVLPRVGIDPAAVPEAEIDDLNRWPTTLKPWPMPSRCSRRGGDGLGDAPSDGR